MVELLQDKDIVITSNEIRNQILKELTNKKIMQIGRASCRERV